MCFFRISTWTIFSAHLTTCVASEERFLSRTTCGIVEGTHSKAVIERKSTTAIFAEERKVSRAIETSGVFASTELLLLAAVGWRLTGAIKTTEHVVRTGVRRLRKSGLVVFGTLRNRIDTVFVVRILVGTFHEVSGASIVAL